MVTLGIDWVGRWGLKLTASVRAVDIFTRYRFAKYLTSPFKSPKTVSHTVFAQIKGSFLF